MTVTEATFERFRYINVITVIEWNRNQPSRLSWYIYFFIVLFFYFMTSDENHVDDGDWKTSNIYISMFYVIDNNLLLFILNHYIILIR